MSASWTVKSIGLVLLIAALALNTKLLSFVVSQHEDCGINDLKRGSETVHAAYGLSGNRTDFFEELETSLKSILLNAPLDGDLHIHFIADSDAFDMVHSILAKVEVTTWRTRNQITITSYNVEARIKQFKNRLRVALPQWSMDYVLRHSIGNYFGLFLKEILPSHVHHALLLDTDVVVMANLAHVWHEIETQPWFQWGEEGMCAGFMILNVRTLDQCWDYIKTIDVKNIVRQRNKYSRPGDQMIYKAINYSIPEKVGKISPAWDFSTANKISKYVDNIVEARPEVGMMHFNGGSGKGTKDPTYDSAFETHYYINKPEYNRTFGLAKYYLMPWTWARFMARSQTIGDGHSVKLEQITLKQKSLKPFKGFRIGDQIEAKWEKKYYKAEVIDFDSTRNKVFVRWDDDGYVEAVDLMFVKKPVVSYRERIPGSLTQNTTKESKDKRSQKQNLK